MGELAWEGMKASGQLVRLYNFTYKHNMQQQEEVNPQPHRRIFVSTPSSQYAFFVIIIIVACFLNVNFPSRKLIPKLDERRTNFHAFQSINIKSGLIQPFDI